MKITILKEKLKSGISTVERISGKSLTLPILDNILLSAEKNFLNLVSTDLEIGIQWWSLVKTEKEGKIAVPAKVFSNLISFLPEKPIELEVEGLNLKIKCDNYQTTIKGFNPEEFPIIPKVGEGESVAIKTKDFCDALGQVVDVASFSSVKPEISGIYFLFQKNLLTVTATDSFRLAEKKLYFKTPLNISKDYSFILPQRTAREIINIFGGKEEEIRIYFSSNQLLFETIMAEAKHPSVQLVSRLVEGEYPNYQEIIPQEYETKVVIPKNDSANQIKLASLFSSKINEIKIKVDPEANKIQVLSQNSDVGQFESFLTGAVEGKSCEISFNHKFLLDGFNNLKSPDIILELNGSNRPGILKQKTGTDYLYLVMPIKTD